MDKAKKMDVTQKFRRIKHNLVNSSKTDDEELRNVMKLENRNAKIIQCLHSYKKNVGNCIRSGLKEENVEKRKKKLDEYHLYTDLQEEAQELDKVYTTCLHKVVDKISKVVEIVLDERVKHEVNIEKRVLDDLSQYLEIDKNLAKSREKLANAYTDLDIARKASGKTETKESYQDTVDAAQAKFESQKDNMITEIYGLVSKEQEIAKICASLLEEQLEFHRVALRTIEMALPEIRRDIDNARPRPVFGVDLTEHLRHSQSNGIAVVLQECCELLRRTAFHEKGVFRVNGNNMKIKRMKASFDAGQIHNDINLYINDPHSVCSVLKSYLRELPDPLLTHGLHKEWTEAIKPDGRIDLIQIENCIKKLPDEHRKNLTYLMQFLVELLEHQEETSMTASNLAIVFGPNLLGGDIEGNNAIGTKIVEVLLKNASRLFGCTVPDYHNNDVIPPAMTRSLIEEPSMKRNDGMNSIGRSPRPRTKAPSPPPVKDYNEKKAPLIDLSDEWTPNQTTVATSKQFQGYIASDDVPSQVNLLHNVLQQHSPPSDNEEPNSSSESIVTQNETSSSLIDFDSRPLRPPPPNYNTPNGRPVSYNMAVDVSQSPTPLPRHQSVQKKRIVTENNISKVEVTDEAPPPLPPKPPLPAKPKAEEFNTSRL